MILVEQRGSEKEGMHVHTIQREKQSYWVRWSEKEGMHACNSHTHNTKREEQS